MVMEGNEIHTSENKSCPSSSSMQSLPGNSDEFSLFLSQILRRSSSSSVVVSHTQDGTSGCIRSGLEKDGVFGEQYGADCGSASASAAANVCSSSVGGLSENETDENDCGSEELREASAEEAPARVAPPRSSSKRSRAAEVHNLSEKRRRSRINEKMKALQNLIPNSNKTDKASMLDEAIEYLKQLQLQVQMLSMRNGLSLHPLCFPGVLQPLNLSHMRTISGEEYQSLRINTRGTPVENHAHNMFNFPNKCLTSNQPSVPTASNIINPEPSFGLESSYQATLGHFQLHTSEDYSTEGMVRHPLSSVNHTEACFLESSRAMATGSLPPYTRASNLKGNSSPEASIAGSHSDCAIPSHDLLTPYITRTISRITCGIDTKMEGQEL